LNAGNVNGYDNDTFNDGGNQLPQQSSQDGWEDEDWALNTINQLNQPTIFSGIKKFTLYYST
jgi:hypothetical protein